MHPIPLKKKDPADSQIRPRRTPLVFMARITILGLKPLSMVLRPDAPLVGGARGLAAFLEREGDGLFLSLSLSCAGAGGVRCGGSSGAGGREREDERAGCEERGGCGGGREHM